MQDQKISETTTTSCHSIALSPGYILPLPNNKFPNCINCFDDAYSLDLSNLIFYIIHKKYPKWINVFCDKISKERKKKNMRTKSKDYTIKKCRLGNYHLLNRSGAPLPMLKQTLNVLLKTHTKNHYQPEKMRYLIGKTNYHFLLPSLYMYSFIKNCEKCYTSVDRPIPLTYRQNLYEKIAQIRVSQKIVSYEKFQIFNKIQFNLQECPFNCVNDRYESSYLKFVPSPLQDKFQAPKISAAMKSIYQEKLFGITKQMQYFTISVCNKGTYHLWKLPVPEHEQNINRTQHELQMAGCKRVPMINERFQILKDIHDKVGHLSIQETKLVLKNLPFCIDLLEKTLYNERNFCEKCIEERRLIPITQFKGKKMKNQMSSEHVQDQEEQFLNFPSEEKEVLHEKLERQELQSLMKEGVRSESYEFNDSIAVSVFATDQMIRRYRPYADCIYFEEIFDFTINHKVFIFTGINKKGFPSLFAFVTLTEQTHTNFFYAFKLFFKLMRATQYPKSMYMSVNPDACSAFSSFKQYSRNLSIRNIKIMFFEENILYKLLFSLKKRQKHPQLILHLFMKALKAETEKQYKDYILRLCFHQKNKELLQFFVNVSESCCISMIPRVFCAQSFKKQHIQHIKEQMKYIGQFLYPFDFLKLLQDFQNRFEQTPKTQIRKKTKFLQQHELKSYQLKYSDHIINKLVENMMQAEDIVLTKIDKNKVIMEEKRKISLIFSLKHNHWVCECKKIYRDGIPCSHLIWIIKHFKGDYRYYINERWLL